MYAYALPLDCGMYYLLYILEERRQVWLQFLKAVVNCNQAQVSQRLMLYEYHFIQSKLLYISSAALAILSH